LIWLYFTLWLIEGGLRRWFLPGLATPLLLVRDPLVIVIYGLAFSRNLFVYNGFIWGGFFLAILCLFNALLLGHGSLPVALYGLRCDFLHLPLIFIIGRVLRQSDVLKVAKIAVWLSIPYTALLVAQFHEPQSAWVNRGVGGSLEGAGFSGAEGHFRPPGTFSFITGPTALYPLFCACWFVLLLARKLPGWLMLASGVAILVAIPVSISRTLCLQVAIVAVVGLGVLLVGGRLSFSVILQLLAVTILIPILALQLPAFKEGISAFSSRWQVATTDNGGFKVAIVDRVINDFVGSFDVVGYSGLGTGFSTNVGQKLLTSQVGFGASEGEWGRLLYDNGLILGGLLVLYRLALAGAIVLTSLKACQRGAAQSLVFVSACLLYVLEGQWGQPTTLGAAVIGAGLALASTSDEEISNEILISL
jgi:hypothetical protein